MPIISKKLTTKKAKSVHHVGDKEVRGVKAAINKIVCTKFFSKELQK